ncbi:hypothetical protein BV25DRAFT_1915733 [Artomyces pyxidatus]|uniref:Uncharacterized protein n=1 Tax=Artomyces pyxidatus TaxID=48021 RepID=A0ACB8T4H3_9AGAM|nr:hypothetical protein BV25DRAFT_1915733 [Artomyces pyxidatus]
MLPNLFFLSLAALAPVTYGSSLRRASTSAISCLSIGTGNLTAYTPGNNVLPAAGSPVSLLSVSATTSILIIGGAGDLFELQACSSTYMGYPEEERDIDTTIYFGHIIPVKRSPAQPLTCLSVPLQSSGATDPYQIVNFPCSYADNATQITQFWKVSQSTKSLDSSLSFLGKTSTDPNEIQWSLIMGRAFDVNAPAILATANTGSRAVPLDVKFELT